MADRERLRVLFLPDYSGSNPYQRELAKALREQAVDVVAAPPPGRDPLAILRAWWTHGRPGVVHIHWTHNYLGQRAGRAGGPTRLGALLFVAQLRLLRRSGVRLVWTVHNLGGHDGSLDPRDRAVHRRLVLLCDAVICHCEAAAQAVMGAYGLPEPARARLHVIPHGSYVGAYPDTVDRASARAALNLPVDARIFLFFGQVRPYKGLHELVSDFASIDDPNLRLVVAGEPRPLSIAGTLRAAAAADPRIVLDLRFVADDKAQAYLRAADAVVLPFQDVLTSGSAILAMSFGRALVVPALGCLPETIPKDGAVLYAPDESGGLTRALRTAVDADLEAMGARNLVRARALSWSPIAATTAALYRSASHPR